MIKKKNHWIWAHLSLLLCTLEQTVNTSTGKKQLSPAGRNSDNKPASASCYQHGMRVSTTVPNDQDTHDDFKPTNKLDNSDLTLKDIVEQDVKDNPVMIYMKGDPELPRCGFSSSAVRVLKEYRIPLSSRNILEDPDLKNAAKSFSTWPTFPQIFINGEFIGGSDIILNMHQTGELEEKVKAVREITSKT